MYIERCRSSEQRSESLSAPSPTPQGVCPNCLISPRSAAEWHLWFLPLSSGWQSSGQHASYFGFPVPSLAGIISGSARSQRCANDWPRCRSTIKRSGLLDLGARSYHSHIRCRQNRLSPQGEPMTTLPSKPSGAITYTVARGADVLPTPHIIPRSGDSADTSSGRRTRTGAEKPIKSKAGRRGKMAGAVGTKRNRLITNA